MYELWHATRFLGPASRWAGPWFSYRLSTAQALTPGAP
jgi:hypothetical protein